MKEIDIGLARVTCVRITYLGELGYELNIPSEQAVHVYDVLVEAGQEFGLRHAGLRAFSSLRMEKAYRDYGHDIDNTDPLRNRAGFCRAPGQGKRLYWKKRLQGNKGLVGPGPTAWYRCWSGSRTHDVSWRNRFARR